MQDAFSRTVAAGWGTAASGHRYSAEASAGASVASGRGQLWITPGRTGQVVASGTSATDARAAVTVSVDKQPTAGNGASASLQLRRTGPSTAYRATLRFGRDKKVSLKLERGNGGDTVLVADTLLPQRATSASTEFRFEFQVTGTSPVTLAARAWPVGASTPDWQVRTQDSSAQRLTKAGTVAVRGGVSGSTAATALRFDDLLARTLVPATATPAPTATSAPTATPKPTATPTPKPTTAPAPTPAPAPATGVGSAPVGTTAYAVPARALHVQPRGDDKGDGSAASPFGSAAAALRSAPTGATIVLHGGTYHESVQVPFNRALTIQAAPNEAVWFDGSRAVTGWKKSGYGWYVDGWDLDLDHRVSLSAGQDESSRYVDPAYPMAGYPDQVWVGGNELTQVGSAAQVAEGSFFVDRAADRLVIGTDPGRGEVRASVLQKAIQIQGEGTTVRGIGVQRYGDHAAVLGVVSAEVPDITLENLVVRDNASIGVYVWAKGSAFSRLTLEDNGLLGLVASKADDLTIDESVLARNNSEHFKAEPASGGAKLHNSSNVTVQRSVFDSNVTRGLWFDVDMRNSRVVHNTVVANGVDGVEIELSENIVVAGNYLHANGEAGLKIFDSGAIAVSNNMISGNRAYAIRMLQDERRGDGSHQPWILRRVDVRNNVLAGAPGSTAVIQVHDFQQQAYAKDLAITFAGNLYQRSTAKDPSRLVQWAAGPQLVSYSTLADFRSATGNDATSKLVEGSAVVAADLTLAATGRTAAQGVPVAVTDSVAGALGVPSGWKGLGPTQPPRP
ncbi:right-handed parallel beta-helix repeat-containing protein [Cellulomonas shaoxiangyii]|uniref:Right-handed parallel beta-helix repeat-containing protein n=1 Tax=Cellulomonas shaoxiangyii TaxID=2566013 RepID=A0A4P7SKY3_9CELL|nr:right-handed parallel beta-helix repeat-containing protein [Cellulomonas shaoxiangyii]QCB94428.1 right-handed parallel beta-helix repeat-containing protein [Cellulomonas shaoxiangyii]TGY85167.1 right-handed parallel beta-helix repeat-containing protein [Cellulomonas shaoxiangyii]